RSIPVEALELLAGIAHLRRQSFLHEADWRLGSCPWGRRLSADQAKLRLEPNLRTPEPRGFPTAANSTLTSEHRHESWRSFRGTRRVGIAAYRLLQVMLLRDCARLGDHGSDRKVRAWAHE